MPRIVIPPETREQLFRPEAQAQAASPTYSFTPWSRPYIARIALHQGHGHDVCELQRVLKQFRRQIDDGWTYALKRGADCDSARTARS